MDKPRDLPTIQEGLAAYESDYYAVLGIPINAPEAEIRATYSNLAKKLQVQSQKNLFDQFQVDRILKSWIQPAYAILTDPEQRFEYDALLKQQIQTIHPQAIKELWPNWRHSSQQDRDPNWVYNYSKAVKHLRESLYISFDGLTDIITQLSYLNLDYLLMSCGFDINVNFEEIFIQIRPIDSAASNSTLSSYNLAPTEIDITLLNELLPDTHSGETRFKQSLQMIARGQYKDAIQFLSFAISQDPSQSAYYALRGIAYHRQGFKGMARADYQQALKLD